MVSLLPYYYKGNPYAYEYALYIKLGIWFFVQHIVI